MKHKINSYEHTFYATYLIGSILIFTYWISSSCTLQNDFMSFYVSTKTFFNGINPYGNLPMPFGGSENSLSVNLNPPSFFIFFKLFTLLTYGKALLLWNIFCFCCSMLSIYLLVKYFKLPKPFYTPLLILFFASPAYLTNVMLGQMGSIYLLGLTLGFYLYEKNQYIYSGLSLGMIAALKISPLYLLIFILWTKNRTLFLSFNITFIIISLLPLLFWDVSIYQYWQSAITQIKWHHHSLNNSLSGLLYKTFDSAVSVYQHQTTIQLANLGFTFLLSLGLISYLYRYKKTLTANSVFSLCIILMLMLNPLSWNYYSLALLLPFIQTWQHIKSLSEKTKWLLICISIMTLFPYQFGLVRTSTSPMWMVVSFYSLSFYGLCSLLVFSMYYYIKQASTQITPFKKNYIQLMMLSLFYVYGILMFLKNYTFNLSKLCL